MQDKCAQAAGDHHQFQEIRPAAAAFRRERAKISGTTRTFSPSSSRRWTTRTRPRTDTPTSLRVSTGTGSIPGRDDMRAIQTCPAGITFSGSRAQQRRRSGTAEETTVAIESPRRPGRRGGRIAPTSSCSSRRSTASFAIICEARRARANRAGSTGLHQGPYVHPGHRRVLGKLLDILGRIAPYDYGHRLAQRGRPHFKILATRATELAGTAVLLSRPANPLIAEIVKHKSPSDAVRRCKRIRGPRERSGGGPFLARHSHRLPGRGARPGHPAVQGARNGPGERQGYQLHFCAASRGGNQERPAL